MRNGHKVRVMMGEGLKVKVGEDLAKKMSKMKPNKGMTIQLSPEELALNRQIEGEGIFSNLKKCMKQTAAPVGGSGLLPPAPAPMKKPNIQLEIEMEKEGMGILGDIKKAFSKKSIKKVGKTITKTAKKVGEKIEKGVQKEIKSAKKVGKTISKTAEKVGEKIEKGFKKEILNPAEKLVKAQWSKIVRSPEGRKISKAFTSVKKLNIKDAKQFGNAVASALIYQGIPMATASACGAIATALFPEGGFASSIIGSQIGKQIGVAIANKIGEATGVENTTSDAVPSVLAAVPAVISVGKKASEVAKKITGGTIEKDLAKLNRLLKSIETPDSVMSEGEKQQLQ